MLFCSTETQDEGKSKAKAKKSSKQELIEWIIAFSLAILFAIFLRLYVFEFIRVEGPSMEDTLFENQFMFVTKIDYRFGDPQRGDVVVCRFPRSSLEYVKRVVGLPGDNVIVMGGSVYINNTALDEPYVTELIMQDMAEYTVPEGSYFVMGDNRNNSMDSRDPNIGALTRDMIIGHTRAVIWPLTEIRAIGAD